MANQYTQLSGLVATSTTAKTVVSLITGANVPATLIEMDFSSDGASVTTGTYLVELVLYGTDGTGTAGTSAKYGATQATTQSTTKTNYTVEPTSPTVLRSWSVAAEGTFALAFPLGREPFLPVSKVLGIRVTSPSGTPNIHASLIWEE